MGEVVAVTPDALVCRAAGGLRFAVQLEHVVAGKVEWLARPKSERRITILPPEAAA